MKYKNTTLEKFKELLSAMKIIQDEFDNQSDRGLAVLSVCFLDVMLESILERFFVQDETKTKFLFDPEQPLGTFSAKIKITHALGLISDRESKELNTIRKIRNKFAHLISSISFDNNSIKDRCQNLLVPNIMYSPKFSNIMASHGIVVSKNDDVKALVELEARDRFIESVRTMIFILMVRLVEGQKMQRPRSEEYESPEDFFGHVLEVIKWQITKHRELTEQYDNLIQEKQNLLLEKKGKSDETLLQKTNFTGKFEESNEDGVNVDEIIKRLESALGSIKQENEN